MAANRPAQKRPGTASSSASNSKSAMIWGALAFCSIIAVCALFALQIGAAGNSAILARNALPPPSQPIVQKAPSASEFEIARLNDAVRTLASERDRLAARVDTLEQSLGDITASINAKKAETPTPPVPAPIAAAPAPIEQPKPQEVARAPEPPAPALAPIPAPAPQAAEDNPSVAAPAATAPTAPQKTAAAPPQRQMSFFPMTTDDGKSEPSILERMMMPRTSPTWIDRPGTTGKVVAKNIQKHKTKLTKSPPAIAPLPPEAPDRTAAAKPGTQSAQVLASAQQDVTGSTQGQIGLDLGGETSIEGLRARWLTLKGKNGDLAGLRPLVRVREGSKPGTVELHLVAGPVANAGTAARVCAALKSTGTPCQASEFDGQKLPH